MTKIDCWDIEAKMIEKIANDNDIMIAEVIELLMDYVDQMKKENGLK